MLAAILRASSRKEAAFRTWPDLRWAREHKQQSRQLKDQISRLNNSGSLPMFRYKLKKVILD
jgi:hypothetical protein